MARFSRLRRLAALLCLTAGFGSLGAGATSAREIGDFSPLSASSRLAVASLKRGMIEARHRGFHALVQAAATQDFSNQPTMVNGKTLAQVIVKKDALETKKALARLLGGTRHTAATIACAAITQGCCDSANDAELETLSLKFRAREQLESAALAHCREIAVNTHLFGSILTDLSVVPQTIRGGNVAIAQPACVELPGFCFETVTTTVTVPDGGTILIGAKKFEQGTAASVDVAKAAGMESSRRLMQIASPTPLIVHHVGADGLERIGIDFDIVPRIIISEEEEESLLGVVTDDVPPVPPAPRTLAAALMANAAKRGCQFHCVQISPADFIEVTAYRAVTGSYEALLKMPFSLEKLLTLQVEITPLLEEGSAGITGCFGPEKRETPTLRMSSLTQERMMRHLANMAVEEDDCPGFKCADANIPANAEYQFPNVNEWKSYGCTFGPALDEKPILRMPSRIPERLLRLLAAKSEQQAELDDCPGFKCAEVPTPISETEYHFPEVTSWKQLQAKRTDAAPAENPEETGIEPLPAEFVQQLPPRGDAPLANPAAVSADPVWTPKEIEVAVYNPALRGFQQVGTRLETPEGEAYLFNETRPRVVSPTMSPVDYAETFLARDHFHDGSVQPTSHDEPVTPALITKPCDNPLLRALGGPSTVTPCESETCRGFTIQFAPCEKPAAVAEAQAFDGPAQILLQDGPGKLENGFSLTAQPAPEESLDELAQRLERDFLRRAVSGQIQVPEACQSECVKATPECGPAACSGCPVGSPCGGGIAPTQYGGPNVPMPLFGSNIGSNAGVCGNIMLDHGCVPAPGACVAATAPCFGAAPCCGATNPTSTAGCQCAECPKGCGGECCCAKKDAVSVPAVTWNPYVTEPPTMPSCTVPAPLMAMVPHAPPLDCSPLARAPQICPSAVPVMATARTAVNPEMLELHRDISRTIDQLAERCETQGLFEKADELREVAQEYREGARTIHKQLKALAHLPIAQPVAWYPAPPMMPAPMMPYPMPAPPTYAPEPMPTFGPPPAPVAPATYPQPLPIAQPMMVPRY